MRTAVRALSVVLLAAAARGQTELFTSTGATTYGSSLAVAGDVNGDGHDDLIAGAPFDNTGGFLGGAAYIAVNLPFHGGILVPAPEGILALALDASGNAAGKGTWPHGAPPGLTVLLQCWIPDRGGPQDFAASNAISVTAP